MADGINYYSAKIEHGPGELHRVIIFGAKDDRVFVDRIAEGGFYDLQVWFMDQDDVTHVRMPDGSDEEPDCLTVWEAMEATYAN